MRRIKGSMTAFYVLMEGLSGQHNVFAPQSTPIPLPHHVSLHLADIPAMDDLTGVGEIPIGRQWASQRARTIIIIAEARGYKKEVRYFKAFYEDKSKLIYVALNNPVEHLK